MKQNFFNYRLPAAERLWTICLISLTGFLAAIFFHHFQSHYLGNGYPYNSFLFNPADHFKDFTNTLDAVNTGNSYGSRFSVYFPLTYVLLTPFTKFNAITSFYFLFSLGFIFIVLYCWNGLKFIPKTQRALATLLLTATSYPLLFCLDRGNLDLFVFIFSCMFVQKWRKSEMINSAFFLSLAISMKGYPGIFGLLFLLKGKVKPVILTFALVVVETILSLLILPNTITENLNLLSSNLGFFQKNYIMSNQGIQFATSYFNVYKLFTRYFFPDFFFQILTQILL